MAQRLEPQARGVLRARSRPGPAPSAPASATASSGAAATASRTAEGAGPAASSSASAGARRALRARSLAVGGGELEAIEQLEDGRLRVVAGILGEGQQQDGQQQHVCTAVVGQRQQGAPGEALVELQAGVDALQHAERTRAHASAPSASASPSARRSSAPTRAPETLASAPAGERRAGQLGGARLGREAQPRLVAREAQQPRGIVEEAALVQHPQAPGGEVLERVLGREQAPALGPAERAARSR